MATFCVRRSRLKMQLKRCDTARLEAECQIADLQAHAHQVKAAVAQQLQVMEAKYLIEFDHSVQALLKIIKHHEMENEKLKAEMERLRTAASAVSPPITKVTQSTQTKTFIPLQNALKKNSVRFEAENDLASNEKISLSVDLKAKASSTARMQQLFEQLQASTTRAESIQMTTPIAFNAHKDNEHRSCHCSNKAVKKRGGKKQSQVRYPPKIGNASPFA
ncbi:uncharacterized protein PHALS_10554 [Plasmopara halstedii]|uniref:Uncharacterized protein n=1 Tax=Plasmopara halstedii TaxID=4781 RepID=A0A0P1AI09_PLAHL|nr:uncharacterized protein PHALS_10554 [Plasmopara halstedii]CEG40350.1 hypothetical protein PHALS_10554 [Plasmopara halstedii]|eukprot:XP_024576719.1 hypothetical protein PHALS_10554 [Plasmopara halstedii]